MRCRGIVNSLTVLLVFGLICAARGEGDVQTETTDQAMPKAETKAPANPLVIIETSLGTIKAELWADKAPATVDNFLAYVDKQHYDGLIFHRIIKGFMVQGGGFTGDMQQRPTLAPVKNEARADVPNSRGTLAMARTSVIDSATSQFFINLVDNAFLNHTSKDTRGYGYCVFGKVIEGMDVVDKMAAVATGMRGGQRDVPVEPLNIVSVKRAE